MKYIYVVIMIVFVSVLSCLNVSTTKDLYKTIEEINTYNIQDLSGWKVIRRNNDSYAYIYYFEHNDSLKFDYINDTTLIPLSKYQTIGFMMNKSLDSIYKLNGYKSMRLNDGLELISSMTNSDYEVLLNGVSCLSELNEMINVNEVISYPWTSDVLFVLYPSIQLVFIKDIEKEKVYIKEGYIKLEQNWFYKFE